MRNIGKARLLIERRIENSRGGEPRPRPTRPVTVNVADSPLGWLFARGLVNQRQFGAGERLRSDWEPPVTMTLDAAPVAKGRGGSADAIDPTAAQIDAKRRFHDAVSHAGPGSPTFYGAWFVPVRGCAMRRLRSAGQLERGSSC